MRGKQDSCTVCRAHSVYKHVGRVTRDVEDWMEEVSMKSTIKLKSSVCILSFNGRERKKGDI